MNLKKILISILIIIYNCNYVELNCTRQLTRPILIVISFDGFRNAYFDEEITPSLLSFRRNGVYSDYLKTIFPTNALSSHHTIATGFYANKHGVVGHTTFIGRDKLTWFGYNEELYNYNKSIIPIWLLNEQNGGVSASMMWPGAEFPAGPEEKTPTYYVKYNVSMSIEDRFRQIVDWLNRTRNQPNLIMVYINEPDTISHIYGPNNKKNLTDTLKRLDQLRTYLRRNIMALRISHRTNVIYLSDHGMWPITPKNFKNLSTLPDCINYYKFIGRHSNLEMGRLYQYRFNLKCEDNIRRMYGDDVFLTRDDLKPRVDINIDRLSNALLVSKKGDAWGDNMWPKIEEYEKKYNIPITDDSEYGIHGYEFDNDAIFMAKGPIFVRDKNHPPFEMVDFYSLFARALMIKGNFSNDGNFSRIAAVFKKRTKEMDWTKSAAIIFICAMLNCSAFYFFVKFFFASKKLDEEEVNQVQKERAGGERVQIEEMYRSR